MNDANPRSKTTTGGVSAAVAVGFSHPEIRTVPVTDPTVLDQARVFAEAVKQTAPIAQPGTAHANAIAKTVRDGTAMPRGITSRTADQYVTTPRSMSALVNGANPKGRAAEIVSAYDCRLLHAGHDTHIVNPPEYVAPNFVDIRIAPDPCSRKDLLFAFETKNGTLVWKCNGQVKIGSAQYVAAELVEMARTPGYGKVGYVDSRYVDVDGTPRVGPGAFTEGQARQLQEAKVQLRGHSNLDGRAEQLNQNIKAHDNDGLDPAARHQSQERLNNTAAAYGARGVLLRIGGGAAIAAASAAVISLVIQLATEGKVDVAALGQAAGTGAAFGAGAAAVDAGLYHFATKTIGLVPEAAKAFAQQGVAAGFCVIAIGTDLVSEIRAARRGEVTVAGAIGGSAAKVALDLLPLVLAPLGLAGLPVLVGVQMGGRWLITKARDADRILQEAIEEDLAMAADISMRMSNLSRTVETLKAECSATDEIYRNAMAGASSPIRPNLQLV